MLIKLFHSDKNDLVPSGATAKKLVLVIAGALLLTACGQKTPVYLPSAAQKQAIQEREARIKARKAALKHETPEQRAAREARIEYGEQRAKAYRQSQETLSNEETQP